MIEEVVTDMLNINKPIISANQVATAVLKKAQLEVDDSLVRQVMR